MVSLRFKKVFCAIYSGLLFMTGIILVVVSAILLYRVFHHFDYIPGSTAGPLILLLILGIAHLFLTWLGMKGPILEHTFHIILFIVFTVILLLTEFTIGVWTMALRDGAGTHATDLMTEAFNEMITEQNYNKNFAKMQEELECCGLDGPQNYVPFKEGNVKLTSYMSCKDVNVPNNNINFQPYEDGCQEMFADYILLLLLEAAILAFLCTVFHGIGLYVFISFYKTLKEERLKRVERRVQLQREMSTQSQQSQTPLPPPQVDIVRPPMGVSSPVSTENAEPVRPPRERASAPPQPASTASLSPPNVNV